MAYPAWMARSFGRTTFGLVASCACLLAAPAALAQPAPSAAFPEEQTTAPVGTPAPAPAPGPAPAPAPAPAPPPAPAPAAAPYAQDPSAQPGYGSAYGEPPPPLQRPAGEDEPSRIPPFSVRLDPFNWLLQGRLGLELEVGLAKWVSIEMIPMFVVNESPPFFNLSNHEDNLYQASGGLGALAGASLGVNFWLGGKAFKGYLLGVGITNYALEYETRGAEDARIDLVKHTERRIYGMFGSSSRWGAFTLSGGIGLAYELNQQGRCFPSGATSIADARDTDCEGELQIALDRDVNELANLNSPLFPMDLMGRISLGVTID